MGLRLVYKALLFVALAVGLVSCARAKVVSWEGQKFTVCGNAWAKEDTFRKVASDRCWGSYRALAGGSMATGDYDISRTNSGASVTAVKRNCVVYECGSK